MTTPYDYDSPPAPGKERGTYMAAATGSFGPDCLFTFIGTAKYLPNRDGSGGKHCTKGNIELSGSGPGCAFKPYETMPLVTETDYTYNGDGTLCERVRLVGGPLAGTEFPFHTYVDPNGRWVFPTTQDIAYPCPNAASNITGINSVSRSRVSATIRRGRANCPVRIPELPRRLGRGTTAWLRWSGTANRPRTASA
ncbi:MAG: hypothetical protein E6J87_22535 [Deltaproteobacteria bacterium]|nr:MAG: hypothetical protein E6J87_22535 [Deltaproteobacteria bacterium]